MKNIELHKKIETTLESIDGIKRAEANPFLYTRVSERLKQPVLSMVQPRFVWQLAASLFIIVALNIGISIYSRPQKTGSVQSTEAGYFTNHIYQY